MKQISLALIFFFPYFLMAQEASFLTVEESLEAQKRSKLQQSNKEQEISDKLVIIEAVSTTGRTFAIHKGYADGIAPRQEALFSTEHVSVAARAVEVSRRYSLWEVLEERAKVPFKKRQFVTFTNTIEQIYFEVPALKSKRKRLFFETQNYLLARGAFSYGLYESVSQSEADLESSRSGISAELAFSNLFMPGLELEVGLRFEREQTLIQDPSLTIPTTRIMFIAGFTYHFGSTSRRGDHFYAGLYSGFGRSATTVNNAEATGTAVALPGARIGYQMNISEDYALLLEGIAESMTAEEKFSTGETQDSSFINGKAVVGIKF